MLCQYCSANFTSQQLYDVPSQNVSQPNWRKEGPIKKNNTFSPIPTVILLIGLLNEIANLLLSRAGEMLQGLKLKVM